MKTLTAVLLSASALVELTSCQAAIVNKVADGNPGNTVDDFSSAGFAEIQVNFDTTASLMVEFCPESAADNAPLEFNAIIKNETFVDSWSGLDLQLSGSATFTMLPANGIATAPSQTVTLPGTPTPSVSLVFSPPIMDQDEIGLGDTIVGGTTNWEIGGFPNFDPGDPNASKFTLTITPIPVPEPGSLSLLAFAGIMTLGRRLRRTA